MRNISWAVFTTRVVRAGSAPWWLGACLAWLQIGLFARLRADDAFITYHYGQNLARGLGPVFNPGERVQGFTSPGHMLLSAAVHVLQGRDATPAVMSALGCIGWSAQAVALFLLLERSLGRWAAASAASLIGLGAAGAASFVPLETHLVSACVLFALWAVTRERWSSAALLCGWAVLFRPDASLAAALVLGTCLVRCRRAALGPIALFVGVALPWSVFAQIYYGHFVPQTAAAKLHRAALEPYLVHVLTHPSARLLWSDSGAAVAWLVLGVMVCGAVRLWRRGQWQLPLLGVLHAAAYTYLRPFVAHTWHLYPWTLVFCVSTCVAIAPLSTAVGASPPSRVGSVLRWLGAAGCAGLVLIAALRLSDEATTLADSYWHGQRDQVYRRLADYLRAHARAGDGFASVEVGTIAYYSDLPAHDLGGLVTTPEMARSRPLPRYLVLDQLYARLAPPIAPLLTERVGDFVARIYEVPRVPPSNTMPSGQSRAGLLPSSRSPHDPRAAHPTSPSGR
ncbi:MAG: hypothetical protein ABW321_10045 [Polyangiales bacterium]